MTQAEIQAAAVELAQRLRAEFNQRNEGIDNREFTARVNSLASFAREWARPNDTAIILERARATLGFAALIEMLMRYAAAHTSEELKEVYSGILDLGMYLYALAEARMTADVKRRSEADDAK